MQGIAYVAHAIAECAVTPRPVGQVAVLTSILESKCSTVIAGVVSVDVTHSGIASVGSGISSGVCSGTNKVGTNLWIYCDSNIA